MRARFAIGIGLALLGTAHLHAESYSRMCEIAYQWSNSGSWWAYYWGYVWAFSGC